MGHRKKSKDKRIDNGGQRFMELMFERGLNTLNSKIRGDEKRNSHMWE